MHSSRSPLAGITLAFLASGLACASTAEERPPARAQAPGAAVVAQVGGRSFTLDEVDAKAMAQNVAPYQELYEARSATLEAMIDDHLLQQEATSRGTTPEELLRQEVDAKVPPVTDADVEAFFKQNQARLQGQTLEQVKGQIQQYLQSQSAATARNTYLNQLRTRAGSVKVALEPPRVEVPVAANDPAIGSAAAKVTIVEFSDFQCPYCSRMKPTLDKIRETYGDRVRIVFRDFPLPMHPQAGPAAEGAQCANEQGKFWEYHDKLFANQRALAPEDLKRYAAELGLDASRFAECFDSGRYKADVAQDYADGQRAGVSGTPAFFVNGRFLSGARPFEAFQKIIDEELLR